MEYVTTEKIPTWAVYYLEYGDPTGMSEEDISQADEFINENFPHGFVMDIVDHNSYFTYKPAFGLACDVYDVKFYNP